jgi:hypothetical protein
MFLYFYTKLDDDPLGAKHIAFFQYIVIVFDDVLSIYSYNTQRDITRQNLVNILLVLGKLCKI